MDTEIYFLYHSGNEREIKKKRGKFIQELRMIPLNWSSSFRLFRYRKNQFFHHMISSEGEQRRGWNFFRKNFAFYQQLHNFKLYLYKI